MQLPLIWQASVQFQAIGAVVAIVVSYLLMVIGYVVIAKRTFFQDAAYSPPVEVYSVLLLVSVIATVLTWLAMDWPIRLAVYGLAILGMFAAVPVLRDRFSLAKLLKLDFV